TREIFFISEPKKLQKMDKNQTSLDDAFSKVNVFFDMFEDILQKQNEQIQEKIEHWQGILQPSAILTISALQGIGLSDLLAKIIDFLPVHPPYFPKDELTDKPERFFAAEIIRERILMNYKKEIPYSCEVAIVAFKEEEAIIRISAEIYVERATQRAILLGHKGERIKKVGIEARESMEKFFAKKIFLEQYIKVEPDWRMKKAKLEKFGYAKD
ncbi:MAG: GTPase Era, partial [Spirosomataceae bacterium]